MPTYSRFGRTFVKAKPALLLTMCCFPLAVSAQVPTVIPLASEPHHHLALHNEYVNVYEVEVPPRGTVQLHRHEFDAISIMMSNSEVIVRAPGKPDAPQKLSEGQVRLQSRGYLHSTSIESDTTYRNVTVELLFPQQGARNLCAAVIATQGLNCPMAEAPPPAATHIDQAQFETNQTKVTLIRLLPHQSVMVGDPSRSVLVVALDDVLATSSGENPQSSLRPGDFVWLDKGAPARAFRNTSGNEARLIWFIFER
jgi:quercetin dioxygenase-like cupin family protein